MEAGINLYSIRRLLQTESDFLSTVIKLKETGYSYVQFSGAPYLPERIKRVSEKSDMPVLLTHVPLDRIVNDTQALMEEHESFGCKNIGLGFLPIDIIRKEDDFIRTIEKLEKAGEQMCQNGFSLHYHNHHSEFFKYKNGTAFEYIVRNAPHIYFTLDTYWVQYGGEDIYALLDRLTGRIKCVHLKDYSIVYDAEKKVMTPSFAPVGDGTLDFLRIVEKMKKVGAEYFFVEQDDASEMENPFAPIEKSIKYIRSKL